MSSFRNFVPMCYWKVLAIDIGINQIPIFNKSIGDTDTHFQKVLQYSGNTEKVLPILAIPIQYCNINNPDSWIEIKWVWLDGYAVSIWRTVRKTWKLENYWDWSQSACQLAGADYSGLDMLNVKMIQTGSSDVCQCGPRELLWGDVQERLGGFCQSGYGEFWPVPWGCSGSMELENRGRGSWLRFMWKMPVKMVCVTLTFLTFTTENFHPAYLCSGNIYTNFDFSTFFVFTVQAHMGRTRTRHNVAYRTAA